MLLLKVLLGNPGILNYHKVTYGRNTLNMIVSCFVPQSTVNNAKVSINLESPKGGLDAVMQAVACEVSNNWYQYLIG